MQIDFLKKSISLNLIAILGYCGFIYFLFVIFIIMPKINMLRAINYEEQVLYSMKATIRITFFYAVQLISGIILSIMVFIERYLQNNNLLSKILFLKPKIFNTKIHSIVLLTGIFLFFIPICFLIYLCFFIH